jgi:hypothetical protein
VADADVTAVVDAQGVLFKYYLHSPLLDVKLDIKRQRQRDELSACRACLMEEACVLLRYNALRQNAQ